MTDTKIPMDKTLSADVLIVGAGPVGLTLAMDLQQRGASVLVLELRRYKEPPSVKCNHVAARSMEQFRRLGVAIKLRDAGLPPDYPNDVVFRTTVTGTELTRIAIPGRATRFTDKTGPDGWWPTPEPPHRINQTYLEPILLEHTAALPGVTLRNRVEVTGFSQSESGVQVQGRDLDSGEVFSATGQYLVGCDGGHSLVRKGIGAQLQGTAVIQQVQSSYIRAPALLGLVEGDPAWCCYAVNPRRSGSVFAIDGRETWLIHNHLHPHECRVPRDHAPQPRAAQGDRAIHRRSAAAVAIGRPEVTVVTVSRQISGFPARQPAKPPPSPQATTRAPH